MPERKLRVFLCHASQDKPVVRELYQRLLTEGWIDPWLDEEKLLPGQDWDMEIEKAVEAADAVIVCLSDKSVTKEGYVQRELKFAYEIALEKPEGTIFIIPFRLEDCIVPRRLREWHYVDGFPHEKKELAYSRLFDGLKQRAKVISEMSIELERNEKEKLCQQIQKQIEEEKQVLDDLGIIRTNASLHSDVNDEKLVNEIWDSVPEWKKYVGVISVMLPFTMLTPFYGKLMVPLLLQNDPSLISLDSQIQEIVSIVVWIIGMYILFKSRGVMHRVIATSAIKQRIQRQESKIKNLLADVSKMRDLIQKM